jgi:hypothetical protein
MPHPSEALHQAFDHNQPSTQPIPIIIEAIDQPIHANNLDTQLQQANISTTTARTNQNGGGVSYSQSSPRAPPSQVINKDKKTSSHPASTGSKATNQ